MCRISQDSYKMDVVVVTSTGCLVLDVRCVDVLFLHSCLCREKEERRRAEHKPASYNASAEKTAKARPGAHCALIKFLIKQLTSLIATLMNYMFYMGCELYIDITFL